VVINKLVDDTIDFELVEKEETLLQKDLEETQSASTFSGVKIRIKPPTKPKLTIKLRRNQEKWETEPPVTKPGKNNVESEEESAEEVINTPLRRSSRNRSRNSTKDEIEQEDNLPFEAEEEIADDYIEEEKPGAKRKTKRKPVEEVTDEEDYQDHEEYPFECQSS
jgi:hypothetical protein